MKRMIKLGVVSTIYLASQIATAKVTVTSLQSKSAGKNFPVVKIIKQPKVSKKINTFLQLEHLKHLPNVYKKSPFERVHLDEKDCCGGVTFQEWKYFKTPKNIVSVSLIGDATGAYSEQFEVYENFDARTGNQVSLNSLTKSSKKSALENVLISRIRKQIKKYLHSIKQDAQTQTINDETYTEQIDLYQECLKDLDHVSLDWFRFYVKGKNVVFVRGRCSNHAMRALDDLGTFYIELPIHSLQPYLTPYGKNVLSNATHNVTNNKLEGKLLRGKLGKANVHLVVNEVYADGSVDVLYWYNKYKQPIQLDGKFQNNQFMVHESYYDDTKEKWIKTGIVRATWRNGKLRGTWKNAKTKKVYVLTLSEY